jgi:hypothetical protein
MDKVQKHNSFNTNTPSSESYRNYLYSCIVKYKKAQRFRVRMSTVLLTLEGNPLSRHTDREKPRIVLLG